MGGTMPSARAASAIAALRRVAFLARLALATYTRPPGRSSASAARADAGVLPLQLSSSSCPTRSSSVRRLAKAPSTRGSDDAAAEAPGLTDGEAPGLTDGDAPGDADGATDADGPGPTELDGAPGGDADGDWAATGS